MPINPNAGILSKISALLFLIVEWICIGVPCNPPYSKTVVEITATNVIDERLAGRSAHFVRSAPCIAAAAVCCSGRAPRAPRAPLSGSAAAGRAAVPATPRAPPPFAGGGVFWGFSVLDRVAGFLWSFAAFLRSNRARGAPHRGGGFFVAPSGGRLAGGGQFAGVSRLRRWLAEPRPPPAFFLFARQPFHHSTPVGSTRAHRR